MHLKPLAARLCLDLLGKLTALPGPLGGFKSYGMDKRRGKARQRNRTRRGGTAEEGVTGEKRRDGRGKEGRKVGEEEERKGNLAPTIISQSWHLCLLPRVV